MKQELIVFLKKHTTLEEAVESMLKVVGATRLNRSLMAKNPPEAVLPAEFNLKAHQRLRRLRGQNGDFAGENMIPELVRHIQALIDGGAGDKKATILEANGGFIYTTAAGLASISLLRKDGCWIVSGFETAYSEAAAGRTKSQAQWLKDVLGDEKHGFSVKSAEAV